MDFTKQILLKAMIYDTFGYGLNRIKKKYSNRKPNYYKIDIPKHERKGKTSEEIKQMKIEKYEKIKTDEN